MSPVTEPASPVRRNSVDRGPSPRLLVLLFALLFAGLAGLGCVPATESAGPTAEAGEVPPPEGEEEIELAVPMAHLQRHSAKLGYAIGGRNAPLADFYLTETEEALEELREVESYEGYPIARSVEVIMDPTVAPLRQALAAEDWLAAGEAYEVVIDACNRCHAATAHEYLVMEPAGTGPDAGPAPYPQRFRGGVE